MKSAYNGSMLITSLLLHMKSRFWLQNVADISMSAMSFHSTLLNIDIK